MSGHWVYGALLLVLVLHSVALLFASRNGGNRKRGRRPAVPDG